MPELPEVETVRSSLESRVRGCTVSGVIVRRRDVVVTPDDPPGGFSRQRERATPARRVEKAELLLGDTIEAVRRHGKQLALVGASGRAVLIHLGMTGEVMAPGPGAKLRAADHLHVLWTLRQASGKPDSPSAGRMVFRDPRRFGGIWTLPTQAALTDRWRELGPDGLTITANELRDRAGRSARAIKAVLLDQRVVAGVGNIYADEALFRARIHPEQSARQVTAWGPLAEAVRSILNRAVELRGSTLRDYRDAAGQQGDAQQLHQVYGRAGEACKRCGQRLITKSIAQRTTVWCPDCVHTSGR